MSLAYNTCTNIYQKVATNSSTPIQQIVMLYDGAIRFLNQAKKEIQSHDIPAKAVATDRALAIVLYLRGILDFESGGEVAKSLDQIYDFVTRQIIEASARLEIEPLDRCIETLSTVREAWVELAQRGAEEMAPQAIAPSPSNVVYLRA